MTKILFITADPTDGKRLRLGKEYREIQEALKRNKLSHRFELVQSMATRPKDLIQAMLDHTPDIVHFAGHGSDDALWLENDAGKASPATASALKALFERFNKTTSCVILNACSSRPQAKAIARHAFHVIGSKEEIDDDAAIAFSIGLYKGLGNGDDIPQAFKLGCASMELTEPSSRGLMSLIKGSGGAPLDTRFASHLPLVVGMGCSRDEFRGLIRDALDAMRPYGFSEDRYRDYDLSREDYSIHKTEWLLADPEEWRQFALEGRQLVAKLNRLVGGPKVYHFFMRAPVCFAIGLGACLGTKHEAVIHHYQQGRGDSSYVPVINTSADASPDHGVHQVRLRVKGKPKYITAGGVAGAKGKIYASLSFVPSQPAAAVKKLASADRAHLVAIQSAFGDHIPVDADWLQIAREVNTVLLDLVAGDCSELHLFPAMPVPLGFAVGMGLDTRSPVRVHQWYSPETGYREVFRLNELGVPASE